MERMTIEEFKSQLSAALEKKRLVKKLRNHIGKRNEIVASLVPPAL